MQTWHHWILAVVIGYVIGYYFSGLGDMTFGKLIPAKS